MELMFHNLATQLWVKHTFRYGTGRHTSLGDINLDEVRTWHWIAFIDLWRSIWQAIHSCNIAVCYSKLLQRHRHPQDIYKYTVHLFILQLWLYIYILYLFCMYIWNRNTFFFGCQRIAYCNPTWKTVLCFHPSTTLEMKAWKGVGEASN